MRKNNAIAVVLIAISFVVLIPGLYKPLITLTASITVMGSTQELFRNTRSIIDTIRSLHESGNDLVAGLILLFSVIVPFVKGALLLIAMFLKGAVARVRIFNFVKAISKWAMADVFVVGVYVAFLSAKATNNMDAEIHSGFYMFTAYCLISLLSLQFMTIDGVKKER